MSGKQAKRIRCEMRADMPPASAPLEYLRSGDKHTRNLVGVDEKDMPIFDYQVRNTGTWRRNDKYRQIKRHLQAQLKGVK